MVPILFLISCWIVSYWFPDTTLGNAPYIGWSMFWAGIPIFLVGGLMAMGNSPDAETGEVPEKVYSDFFFIPSWIWGVFFICFGLYL